MKRRLLFYLLFFYIVFLQLHPHSNPLFSLESFASTSQSTFRVVSYNIRFGASSNGRPAISLIADFINTASPDIICLQEVDRKTVRSLFLDQPSKLSEKLSMKMVFGRADNLIPGTTGNVILSKFPILSVENKILPHWKYKRSALKATIQTPSGNINVVNVHLSLSKAVRKKQIEILREWILEDRLPTILAGDFNTVDKQELIPILAILNDSAVIKNKSHINTFENGKYNARIDYIFTPKTYFIKAYTVPRFRFSDHYPVIVDLY